MIIFFDIDGTLIDEETHLVPASVPEAVKKARENGHICIINTGRSKKLVDIDIHKLQGFDGMLMGCGTHIVYHGETILHRTYTAEQAKRIIDALRKNKIDAVLEGDRDNFKDSDDNISTEEFYRFIHQFDRFGYKSFEEAPGFFDKFYCFAPGEGQIAGFLRDCGIEMEVVDRKKGYFEIMPKGYTKASGMQFLADYLNIPMTETAGIGDSSNDIPMLEAAQIGIAMGNATPDVKAVADYVTADLDKDGVREALKWLKTL